MMTKLEVQNLNYQKKIAIGCKAVAKDKSITDIAKEFKVSRKVVYQAQAFVSETLSEAQYKEDHQVILMTKLLITRIIIGCMLFCKGSTEGTQRFLEQVFNISVSIGKISSTINQVALKAKEWNESIDLSNINVGANDELFQGSRPILVGIDPKSTFIYLFKLASNRDANTWGYWLLEKTEQQNLWLKSAVSDSGKGIIRGTKDVFGDDMHYQADVFHVKYDFQKALTSLENYAYRCIFEYQKLLKKNKTSDLTPSLETAKQKEIVAIEQFDSLSILFTWIEELVAIGGYFFEDRVLLFKYIIEQLEEYKNVKNSYLKKSIRFIKNNYIQLLEFVKIAENALANLAIVEKVDESVLKLIWEQETYSTESAEYNYIEAEIGKYLGERYWEIRNKYNDLKKNITRASSIVECINSLIRPYIDLKRSLGDNFTHLLQMYFNTRVYRRSRVKAREGKSPYELLTGYKCESFLDILCPADE